MIQWITADVFDGLASLEDGSIDLVITSPPFLALRSYLPADHPDKGKEIGSEATPAEFLDTLLAVTAELRRVLAPHGSIAVELGDTYAGSGGAGGDYEETGLRGGQNHFDGSASGHRRAARKGYGGAADRLDAPIPTKGDGWPLAKSVCMIPEAYRFALAYGFNPFTGQPSPAGKWRVRNKVTWCRPNPPVGALGDKWRPATSDVVIACLSGKRYWDDLATRKPYTEPVQSMRVGEASASKGITGGDNGNPDKLRVNQSMTGGAPLLDYWVIPPGGYEGSHYAVFPPALIEPLVKAMGPQKVCLTCGEPSRRIVVDVPQTEGNGKHTPIPGQVTRQTIRTTSESLDGGWTDCGCSGGHCSGDYPCDDHWRNGIVLDPFAGSGTTLAVATGHGLDAIGIDIDERNAELAEQRIGPLLFQLD